MVDDNIQYKIRKIFFWFLLVLVFFFTVYSLVFKTCNREIKEESLITVGVCGCIKDPGVYRLVDGDDLATLIMLANGTIINADTKEIDLNLVVKNNEIYHIPRRKKGEFEIVDSFSATPDSIMEEYISNDVINFFYVGFPAVYFLITYSKEQHVANVIQIPHSTVFLNNEYRIIDLYFTLGIEPTIDILEKSLNTKIDYYYVQNKTLFIDMIDNLGGVDVYIDKAFAQDYDFTSGVGTLDGWHTFEYIRYIDEQVHLIGDVSSKSYENMNVTLKDAEVAFVQREARQKQVIKALFKKLSDAQNSRKDQQRIILTVVSDDSYTTNIDYQFALDFLMHLSKKSKITIQTLPGEYEDYGENTYFVPSELDFERLYKQRQRKFFKLNSSDNNQEIY